MNTVPRIAVDYFFMLEEDSKANDAQNFVMIDENSGDRHACELVKKA